MSKFTELYESTKQELMEDNVQREFSCVMADITDQSLISDLRDFLESIDKDDLAADGLEYEHHITALYGIHTGDAKDITPILPLKPIKLKLTKLSLFENDDFDVLKYDIESSDLEELNGDLTDKLEYTNNYPDYHAHLTIAYLKPGKGEYYLGDRALDDTETETDKISISLAGSSDTFVTYLGGE